MKDLVVKIMTEALRGMYAHTNPGKVLAGLTADDARKKPTETTRSCWEVLYHMVYWQDITLEVLRGKAIDMDDAMKRTWPETTDLKEDDQWPMLIERYRDGLVEVRDVLYGEDPKRIVEGLDVSVAQAILVNAQHNSYHLGQLVDTRRILELWPPENTHCWFI
jgi:uncharacterized damage-inducible protein DinB